ncbi:radical SAM family heme chaperone HemW [Entomomonas sp. E2T0]|uniref:radical SAM family heme chaperone HemW n=1 Tax=Entomomonas sp. E2T0 TaxID=2930213 RepID=UPI002228164E|nr:radical SAM family heme chaperone HemW [Entomomonas sp. E2T0]UYZ83834.1 radical SAM family heme chaperone HemW [Entomomonas sp. E2T0]
MSQAITLPPLSLYIHIPWCVRKCPYCDFNSHATKGELPEQEYITALLADLALEVDAAQQRPIQSIFIGGGTPSLFSADSFELLLNGIAKQLTLAQDIEITLEANPGTAEQQKFANYFSLGINRLSIGVQSFHSTQLQALGRIHSAQEAIKAVEMAHQAGFTRLNLDLMHGLPEQTPEQAIADLQQAIALQPDHLSWYQLTIEPNTAYWSHPPVLPEDEALWAIQEQGQSLLAENGFQQYEVSAYAKSTNAQAKHNLNYWTFGDFIGIGAGAHGKLTQLDGTIYRNWKTRVPKDYLASNKPSQAGERRLTNEELPVEFMMNALRLKEGVPSHFFTERTYLPLATIDKICQQAIQTGLLAANNERLVATPQGFLFLNNLLEYFLD